MIWSFVNHRVVYFLSRQMPIHTAQVHCDGILYDQWRIDDDHTNIIGLHQAINEDLKCFENDPTIVLHILAHIRGGDHVLVVDSDATMMQMFNLNTNSSDVVLLDVKRVSCPPLAILEADNGDDGVDEMHIDDNEQTINEDEQHVDEDDEEFVNEDEQPVHNQQTVNEYEQPGANYTGHVNDDYQHVSEDSSESDSEDPEWKNGRDYHEEEYSSESIGSFVVSSDDDGLSDGDIEEEVLRRCQRDGDTIDPNSSISEVPSHIGVDGKITLQLWHNRRSCPTAASTTRRNAIGGVRRGRRGGRTGGRAGGRAGGKFGGRGEGVATQVMFIMKKQE